MSLKEAVKRFIGALGYEVKRRAKTRIVRGRHYGSVYPVATYSPWIDDLDFTKVYHRVQPHTFVDIYRCYELWELIGQLGHLRGNLLEVGVWRGGTGALISYRAGGLPGKPVTYLCDTFNGVVKATDEDTSYRGGEHADTSEQHVRDLLSEMGIDNARILAGIFPDDFMDMAKDETFRFVHIDVDVYLSAKDVLNFVWPRVPVGGVIVFDDFGFVNCDGIPTLIAECQGNRDKLVIQNLNGHAIIIKTAG